VTVAKARSKQAPKKPRLNIPLALAQAMAAANGERQSRMASAITAFGIDAATGWSVNLAEAEFRFTFEDHELVGVPQLIGVFSKIGKSWTWGWAVESVPDDAKQTATLAREFARQNDYATMLEPVAVATDAQADGLAALAFVQDDGVFLYRAFGPAADTYLSVSNLRVVN
jgi:hypothetical protein